MTTSDGSEERLYDDEGNLNSDAYWRRIDQARRDSIAKHGPFIGNNMIEAMLTQIGGLDEYRRRYGIPLEGTDE